MVRRFAAGVLVFALSACSSAVRGTLTIEPDEAQDAVRFTFTPESGLVTPGELFLQINSDGAELLFDESRGTQACIGVPANGVVVAGVPPDQSLGCVTIAAVVYTIEEEAETTDPSGRPVEVEDEGPRCGGDYVIDSASWREIEGCPRDGGPVVRDAGSAIRDAGSFVRDGGVLPRDGGGAPDAGSPDAGVVDAGDDEQEDGG